MPSRVGKMPIKLPKDVTVTIAVGKIILSSPLGSISQLLNELVEIKYEDGLLKFEMTSNTREANAMLGTIRALVNNHLIGITKGFEKRLTVVGVGNRAQAQGNKLSLSLGFSHPITYEMPLGVSVETPTPTEILVKGSDKQQVGQVSAEIRGYYPPEPYKGKGVRYSNERIVLKETKKK